MKTPHTPGPFKTIKSTTDSRDVSIFGASGRNGAFADLHIATVKSMGMADVGGEKLKANTALFVGAPELLAVAKHIAAMAGDAYLAGHPEWNAILAEAEDAITKATP